MKKIISFIPIDIDDTNIQKDLLFGSLLALSTFRKHIKNVEHYLYIITDSIDDKLLKQFNSENISVITTDTVWKYINKFDEYSWIISKLEKHKSKSKYYNKSSFINIFGHIYFQQFDYDFSIALEPDILFIKDKKICLENIKENDYISLRNSKWNMKEVSNDIDQKYNHKIFFDILYKNNFQREFDNKIYFNEVAFDIVVNLKSKVFNEIIIDVFNLLIVKYNYNFEYHYGKFIAMIKYFHFRKYKKYKSLKIKIQNGWNHQFMIKKYNAIHDNSWKVLNSDFESLTSYFKDRNSLVSGANKIKTKFAHLLIYQNYLKTIEENGIVNRYIYSDEQISQIKSLIRKN